MTPPFCIISFRGHGFCTPRGQPWAETLEFLDVCVFRSMLSNFEAAEAAVHVLVTKGFVSSEYQAQSSQLSRDLETGHLDILRNTLHLGMVLMVVFRL